MEGRKSSTGIAEEDSSDISNESSGTGSSGEAYTVVAWVRLRDPRVSAGLSPVVITAVNDNAADSSTVTADELSSRMNDNISAILNRTNKERSSESIIHNEGDIMSMSDLSNLFNIDGIGVRISECFDVKSLSILIYSLLESVIVLRINESSSNAVERESMSEEVIGTAIDSL